VSNPNGFIVFTVTPDLAKQMKGFKSGATYVAQRAVAVVNVGEASAKNTRKKASSKKTATKRVTKKASKKTGRKAAVKKTTASKATSRKATKKATVKSTKRSSLTPDIVIKFVRENEGCNMTDIERSVKHPQAAIRRVLNSARSDGLITTEGQRRGLRYFAGNVAPAAN
jgi:predicted RNA-binding protein with PIN domain